MVLRYKDIHAFDNNKTMKIIYSMYRAGEVSVHRACCERATQPYSLGGGGTIYPGSRPAGVTTRCPRMVTKFLLTRSILIKMFKFTISGYVPVYVHCIYSLYARNRSARERRTEGPCVKAILAALFSTVPSWRRPLLGLF